MMIKCDLTLAKSSSIESRVVDSASTFSGIDSVSTMRVLAFLLLNILKLLSVCLFLLELVLCLLNSLFFLSL